MYYGKGGHFIKDCKAKGKNPDFKPMVKIQTAMLTDHEVKPELEN